MTFNVWRVERNGTEHWFKATDDETNALTFVWTANAIEESFDSGIVWIVR